MAFNHEPRHFRVDLPTSSIEPPWLDVLRSDSQPSSSTSQQKLANHRCHCANRCPWRNFLWERSFGGSDFCGVCIRLTSPAGRQRHSDPIRPLRPQHFFLSGERRSSFRRTCSSAKSGIPEPVSGVRPSRCSSVETTRAIYEPVGYCSGGQVLHSATLTGALSENSFL